MAAKTNDRRADPGNRKSKRRLIIAGALLVVALGWIALYTGAFAGDPMKGKSISEAERERLTAEVQAEVAKNEAEMKNVRFKGGKVLKGGS
jgi:hypothetical protein